MAAKTRDVETRRRGRPRAEQAGRFVRRNLLVDAEELEELRRLFGAKSDSEAVRWAVSGALTAHAALELQEFLATRGGPVDAYDRTSGKSRLPVHLTEDDVVPLDDEDIDLGFGS